MKFHCPTCGQKLEVDDEYAGQMTPCPSCATEVTIPVGEPAVQPGEIDESIRETLTGPESTGGMTIAKFMSDRKMEGGVKLGTEVLTEDQNQKYDYGEIIARGGMGAIVRATDLNIRRGVAMKVLLDPDAASHDDILRFIEEAQVTGQLEHPSVVPVHDLGVDGTGNVFYTMKLVKGVTLHEILSKIAAKDEETIAQFSLHRLLSIFQRTCEAMAFAHSRNVIHRDLKPENIMVGEFGEVLVMDWGLAKVLGQSNDDPYASREAIDSVRSQNIDGALATISGTIFGTPQFMAPEQALGATAEMDQRTDIYALGAILFNILTLRPPVQGKTVDEVLTKVTRGEIHTPTTYNTQSGKKRSAAVHGHALEISLLHCPNEKVPEALAAITMKAMAMAREDRYNNIPQLASDIEAFQGGFATSAEEAGALKLLSLFIKRNKLATFSALVISILGLGFVGKTISSERKIRGVSRTAAPEFIQKARVSLEQNRADDARRAIRTAIGLNPKSAEAWYEQARLQFDNYDFENAITSVKRVSNLATNDALRQQADVFREFAEKWDEQVKKDGEGILPTHLIAMAPEAEPIDRTLAGRLFSRVGNEQEALQIQVTQVFKDLLAANPGLEFRTAPEGVDSPVAGINFHWSHIFRETGMEMNIGNYIKDKKKLVNIAPLTRLPFHKLELHEAGVTDLTPLGKMSSLRILDLSSTPILSLDGLQGSSLECLAATRTGITDLSPLRDIPLKKLAIDYCPISDLSPLRGKPLVELIIGSTKVENLEAIRGMPLTNFSTHGIHHLKSIEAIRGMQLEILDLRQCNEIDDLSMLADMPLKSLSLGNHLDKDLSVINGKDFDYLNISMEVRDLSFLRNCQVKDLNIYSNILESLAGIENQRGLTRFDTGTDRFNPNLTDLSPLRGLPLEFLVLRNIGSSDLSPLEGMNLREAILLLPNATNLDALRGMTRLASINIGGGFVDISGIEGLERLNTIYADKCTALTNVRPVMTLPKLGRLVIPKTVTEVEFLRGKPQLYDLGYSSHNGVENFWRDYDAKQ